MNTFEYVVVSLDGDYANLKRTDEESDEIKLVARALLPPETDEGTRLKYEFLQYSIRSEERRVGKECLRLCRSRWSPYH